MNKSLFEELIEDVEGDKKIIKSFKPKNELSDKIFEKSDSKYILRKDIRNRLIEIADSFIESLGIEFFIHDIVLTGSLANYNWSNYSDVDLHIIMDFEETDYDASLLKEFFDAKRNIWNEKHNIKIKGYDVELYVQDIKEPHVSSGVYSILKNKWVIEPKKEEPNIDDKKILSKAEEYGKSIDELENLSKKEDVSSKIESLRKKIKKFRQTGLESGGEYSYENLVFKLLRRNGYIEKLLNLKNAVLDKKLSITQQ
jgi:Nucleotidyltransferase domain